jgi:hypothetical protein
MRDTRDREIGGRSETATVPGLAITTVPPLPRRRTIVGPRHLGPSYLGSWVTARHVEPQVWLKGVDGCDLVRHDPPVQLAPRCPQAGLQVELVTVALFDGKLSDTSC